MSKKFYLLILICAPSIIGYLYNLFYPIWILSISIINYIFLYGFPVLMVYFWFWVGGQFALNNIKIFASVLIGNLIGIVSLFVYFWQYVLIPDNQMNPFLALNHNYLGSKL